MDKTLIITPTYNEKDNIEDFAKAVLNINPDLDLLIVDDDSPDGTGQIADRIANENNRVAVIHRKGKKGLGRAYVDGFRYAIEKKYDLVFEMDADFSHAPKYIPAFMETVKSADLVIGSRYLSGVNVINWPMSRVLLSYCGNIVARIVTGLKLRDCTSGFKCIRRSLLENLNLDHIGSDGYSFQIEVNFKAWKMGFTIKEIPIVFTDRKRGSSKMSSKIIREALALLWKMRVVNIFKPIRPVKKNVSAS